MKLAIAGVVFGLLGAAAMVACDDSESMPGTGGIGGTLGVAGAAGTPATGGMAALPNEFDDSTMLALSKAIKAELTKAAANTGNTKIGAVYDGKSAYWEPFGVGFLLASQQLGFQAATYTDNLAKIDPTGLSALIGQGTNVNRPVAAMANVHYVAVDNDAPADKVAERTLFMGTDNIAAGQRLGKSLADTLGTGSGKVILFGTDTGNGPPRLAGAQMALQAAGYTVVGQCTDCKGDMKAVPMAVFLDAMLAAHPDIVGAVGVWGSHGAIIADLLRKRGKTAGQIKISAFDVSTEIQGEVKGDFIQATMAQRPYWMGYGAAHIALSVAVLGKEKTMLILAPWLQGVARDQVFTDLDTVRKANLQTYLNYLTGLGLQSG